MKVEEALEYANCLKNNYTIDLDKLSDFCETVETALMAIANLKSDRDTDSKALRAYFDGEYFGWEEGRKDLCDKISAEINTPNRGTCDYFIVDRIEEIISEYREGVSE